MVALFILMMFLLFISVDLIILKIQNKYHPAFEPAVTNLDDTTEFVLPQNHFLSIGHVWMKKNFDGLINLGIDAFGANVLGEIALAVNSEIGKELKRGDTIFEGKVGNKILQFQSPIDGIVTAINTNALGKAITNPFEQWGVQLLSTDSFKNKKWLVSGKEASTWMRQEYERLKIFLDNHLPDLALAGPTMYDGGLVTDDTAFSLSEKNIKDFEKEFLSL